jgi:hypothetical protein
VAQVLEAGGPIVHATKADNVRLHDDKVRGWTPAACRNSTNPMMFSAAMFLVYVAVPGCTKLPGPPC